MCNNVYIMYFIHKDVNISVIYFKSKLMLQSMAELLEQHKIIQWSLSYNVIGIQLPYSQMFLENHNICKLESLWA